ncbi:MAG: glycoside hydrolase family 97 N-terminal domain-containing protein, partial [Verrucomicrobia subdivision 3 bacterium]|nr:glycoside hydrolase family 97 N-terminal domain-containing protein [Limisphaerales bacterium]
MSSRFFDALTVTKVLVAVVCLSARFAADAATVASPNDGIRFELRTDQQGHLSWSARFNQRPVIEHSSLAMIIDGADVGAGVDIGAAEPYQVNEKYSWRGVHSEAVNHCNGARIPVTHKQTSTRYTVEVRAYNDAVAFRCVVPGEAKSRVPDEATSFVLPPQATVWYHDLGGHYEDTYERKGIGEIAPGEWAAPPVTFKLPGNAGYASITEAALVNYSGMALQADGERRFKIVLGHKHPISYPFRLRYSNDIERVSIPAAVSGTITTPWRVVLMGADLNSLVNSDIVHNLCPPADPQLFPKGMRTDWIKSGRAVWKYLDRGPSTFEAMKEFSNWAGELGFEYHVIEGFWSRWTDEQIKELVDYSRQRGVGLWFWRHSRQLRTPEARAEFFNRLSRLGVVGAKIDFFDHEHKEIIDLYSTLLREAAKHRIMVNFHGANKPTGEARTWPNELIREGVRGMESSRLRERARHNTTLPFTRFLAGHADYTPVHFGDRRGDTTWAHQVATAAIFNEPLLTYGAHPTNILSNPCAPMIKSIPAVWDETIVLPGSEIGELAAFARHNGTTWFVAVLNGPL